MAIIQLTSGPAERNSAVTLLSNPRPRLVRQSVRLSSFLIEWRTHEYSTRGRGGRGDDGQWYRACLRPRRIQRRVVRCGTTICRSRHGDDWQEPRPRSCKEQNLYGRKNR